MVEYLPDLSSWNCFACGQDHPKGLRLRFTAPEPDRVRTEFEVSMDHVGFGNIVHGGIVATVFDEVMVWTLYRWRYQPHVTAKMEQKFRAVIEAGKPLVAEAWIDSDRGRRREVRAVVTAAGDSTVLAEASGVYLPARDGTVSGLPDDQKRELDAILDGFRKNDGGNGA